MDNNTDLVITEGEVSPYYTHNLPRKIELDDPVDRLTQLRRGVIYWLALPSNPFALVVDALTWVNASAATLLIASVWPPVLLIWLIWGITLAVMSCVPGLLAPSVKLCATVRLILMCIGAVALLL